MRGERRTTYSAASLNVAHRAPSDHPSKEGSLCTFRGVVHRPLVSTLTRRQLLYRAGTAAAAALAPAAVWCPDWNRPQPQHSPPKVESPPQRAGRPPCLSSAAASRD